MQSSDPIDPAAPVTMTTFPSIVVLIFFLFKVHRRAAEQVLHGNFPDLAGESIPFNHLAQSRHRLAYRSRVVTKLKDSSHFHSGGGRNGDKDDFDIVIGNQLFCLFSTPEHGHTINENASLVSAIVKKSTNTVCQPGIIANLSKHVIPASPAP